MIQIVDMNDEISKETEALFKEFLDEYLANVKKELPECYRAQQLELGGMPARMVYEFETKFLKPAFMNALKKYREQDKPGIF